MSHYISTNRSKHYLKCHLILVTKYRRNILVGQLNDDLKSKMLWRGSNQVDVEKVFQLLILRFFYFLLI